MYYAKSKDYVRRAVVFFDGNRQPSNVKADQLQREKQKASSVQLSMDLAKTFVSCYTDTAYAGKFVETLHAMRKEIEAQL
jgi:predicted transcriptional regulator of viral defense system